MTDLKSILGDIQRGKIFILISEIYIMEIKIYIISFDHYKIHLIFKQCHYFHFTDPTDPDRLLRLS